MRSCALFRHRVGSAQEASAGGSATRSDEANPGGAQSAQLRTLGGFRKGINRASFSLPSGDVDVWDGKNEGCDGRRIRNSVKVMNTITRNLTATLLTGAMAVTTLTIPSAVAAPSFSGSALSSFGSSRQEETEYESFRRRTLEFLQGSRNWVLDEDLNAAADRALHANIRGEILWLAFPPLEGVHYLDLGDAGGVQTKSVVYRLDRNLVDDFLSEDLPWAHGGTYGLAFSEDKFSFYLVITWSTA